MKIINKKNKDMPKIPFYVPYDYCEEQAYDSKEGLVEELLDESKKNDEKEFADIDSISGAVTTAVIATAAYDKDSNSILFKNAKGETISTVDMEDVTVSGLIKNAYYDKDTKKIVIEFENGDTVEIDISDVVDINEAGDGLYVDPADDKLKVKIDEASEPYISVSEDGVKITGITEGIETTVEEVAPTIVGPLVEVETERATSAETTLENAITAETERAQAAEEAIQGAVDAEVTRATGAEEGLAGDIADETTRATSAETTLENAITAETERAQAAEDELQSGITAETERAQGVEDNLSNNLAGEILRAQAAEEALSDKVETAVKDVAFDETGKTITFTDFSGNVVEEIDTTKFFNEDDYYKKDETSSKTEIADAVNTLDAAIDNINNVIDALDYDDTAASGKYVSEVDEINGKISVSRADVSLSPLNWYESVYDGAEYSAITEDEHDVITSGDTINEAFNKIETIITTDERVTAAALIDLNAKISGISGSVDTAVNAIEAETGRATTAEAAISGAVTDEVSRAQGVEGTISGNVTSETTRAKGVEQEISGKVGTAFSGVSYNSGTKKIVFNKISGETVELDATAFIKDGMVDNVVITSITSGASQVTVLAITFNCDAGKEEIDIPISDIFNASNYYTKTETDDAIGTAISGLDVSDSAVTGQYISEVDETDGVISVARENVADATVNGFVSFFDGPDYSGATIGDDTKIVDTDTINEAFNKIEMMTADNELVIAQAIIELAARIEALEQQLNV